MNEKLTFETDNRRIARNTLLLYFRMIFWVAVSLYTNRIVLDQLGASDFGIFNVVFGFVTIVSFLPSSMSAAVGRFLNVGLGNKEQKVSLSSIFKATIGACALLSLLVLLLFETGGLWFAATQLNYPPERSSAVMIVYQLCVGNMVIGLLFSPFLSLILAHERMSAYALFSILDATVKLLFVLALPYLAVDKLVAYMSCIFGIGLMLDLCYVMYCRRHFEECRLTSFHFDFSIIRQVIGYCSWNTLQVLTFMLHTQCVAVLVNIFFGTIMNAAYGIALQISNVLKNFAKSFTMAAVPQIMKNYSAGKIDDMSTLVVRSCRMAISLMTLLIVPLLLQAPFVLSLWLKDIPQYTVVLVRIILLVTLADSCSELFTASVGATGKIRNYNLYSIVCGLLHAVMVYVFFSAGWSPVSALWLYFGFIILENMVRIIFVVRQVGIHIQGFWSILLRSILFIVVSFSVPYALQQMLEDSIWTSLFICVFAFVFTMCVAAIVMLSQAERKAIWIAVLNQIHRNR